MARVNDLVALRRNDEHLRYLQLLRPEADASPSALGGVVDALKANTRVSRVRAFLPQDFFARRRRTGDDEEDDEVRLRSRLFEAVGCLPRLNQLKIDSYTGSATFPVDILTTTIQNARSLQELELWDLKLAVTSTATVATTSTGSRTLRRSRCNNTSLQGLKSALQNHPSLKKFTLYNCQLEKKIGCTLDPLLRGLATIPTLKQVYITAGAAASSDVTTFTCSALENLCRQSSSLQELGLWKFNFPPPSSSQQLQDSNSNYSSNINASDPLLHMAPSIGQTNTLRMFEFGKCHLTQAGDMALAAMLAVNTSLEELDLHLDTATAAGDCGCQIVATAQVLETQNTTLKRLKLWGLLDRTNQQALAQMARHNFALQTCRLLDADRDVSHQLDFYIGLNRGGRQTLLLREEDVTSMERWLVFLSTRKDLSTIFYYLSMKPSLFQIASY